MSVFTVVIKDKEKAEDITQTMRHKGIPTECMDCQTGYMLTVPRWSYKILLRLTYPKGV